MVKGMVGQAKLDPSTPSPIASPEPPMIPRHVDEDSPIIDYPGLTLVPYDPKKDMTSKGIRISVLAKSHAALTNGMGLHKAYDHRAEHGITGPGYVVDAGRIYPVDAETLEIIDAPVNGCMWRIDIIMTSTI